MTDWLEVKVLFDSDDPQMAADLIANAFYESGLKGVMIDDPGLEPEEGWGSDAVELPESHGVTGYFPDTRQAVLQCRELETRLAVLDLGSAFAYEMAFSHIDEEVWAESWKTFFKPEKITDHIVVKPTWRDYEPGPDEVVLEIDPGMAFGTGTHPTTAMCVHCIEKYLKPGSVFLDIGTGSGILMLAAAAMGAKTLLGTDKDEIAVRIAGQNMRQNDIDPRRYGFIVSNLAQGVSGRYDFITANILSAVILILLDTIHEKLKKGGILVCSGIITENEGLVTDKMAAAGYEVLEVMTRQEWISIVCRQCERSGKPARFQPAFSAPAGNP